MKNRLIIGVLILIIFGAWFVFRPAYTPSGVVATKTPSMTPTPAVSGHQAITIQNFAFSPATVTIARGTTVTWTNNDSAPHQPTSDSGSVIAAPKIPQGGSFSMVFSQAGTYSYHCAIHPSMTGTIIVQ